MSWQIGPWSRNRRYSTPDLSAIVQELLDERRLGRRFPGQISEVKTGSSGAPWADRSCRKFMKRLRGEVIRLADYPGQGMPYHFAVVDVAEQQVCIRVHSWDGTPLPVP